MSRSDEKPKSLINSPFFCSEFQIVSRIVKIVHSAEMWINLPKQMAFKIALQKCTKRCLNLRRWMNRCCAYPLARVIMMLSISLWHYTHTKVILLVKLKLYIKNLSHSIVWPGSLFIYPRGSKHIQKPLCFVMWIFRN